jgi:hypothetical protein
MESLSLAKGFGDTHEEARFTVVNTSINQIILQLHHLAKTWKVGNDLFELLTRNRIFFLLSSMPSQ